MGQIVAWKDIKFSLGTSSINAVEDIEISGSCETEESETDGEKYVKRKNAKPYEIKMKAILDASLGVDVKSMAKKMTEAARKASKGYFYTGTSKLFPCKFMMVDASIGEIAMNPKGKWLHCEVDMKLKQCTKYDGTTQSASSDGGGGGWDDGGSSSSSSKKTSTKSSSTTKSTLSSSTIELAALTKTTSTGSAGMPSAASKISSVNSFTTIVKAVSAKATTSSSSSSAKQTSTPSFNLMY